MLPQISMLGWARFTKAKAQALAAHQHTNCWEICYLVRGTVDWWAGKNYTTLHAGDVYITAPNQPHGGNNAVMQPCELYWIQVAGSAHRPWPGLNLAETREIVAGLGRLPQSSFPGSPRIAELFQRLLEEHQHRAAHSSLLVRSVLHQLLVQVLRDHAAGAGPVPRHYCIQIATAVQAMEAQPEASLVLAKLAAQAGWSVSYFCQRFTRETGLTPIAYRNHQRIRRAKLLLDRPGHQMTAIAMDLGFSSSQYFATVFRQITGMTPRDYHRRAVAATATTPGPTPQTPK